MKLACGLSLILATCSARILAPLVQPGDNELAIPDHYIVILRNGRNSLGINAATRAAHEAWLVDLISHNGDSMIGHSFNLNGMAGYTGRFSREMIEEIRKRDEVAYVEVDQIVYAYGMNYGKIGSKIDSKAFIEELLSLTTKPLALKDVLRRHAVRHPAARPWNAGDAKVRFQANAPWGLSRVCRHEKPRTFGNYTYPMTAGEGVDVYVIDTGINLQHEEFEGRAVWGKTIPVFDEDIDGNGHGTHVAGTIGSKTYGIAKKARLVAIKVLRTNGFGTNSDVIKGIEWMIRTHTRNGGAKGVANMSLGGGRSLSLERAVNRAVAAGLHFAVAAGNDNEDACNYSPAAASGPITVGASTRFDEMAFFSNHGPCVDMFAPGLDIVSTWVGSEDAVNTISGTSMAAPHVAGVLALYLAEKDYTTKELKDLLLEHSTKDILTELPENTENRLLGIEPLLQDVMMKAPGDLM